MNPTPEQTQCLDQFATRGNMRVKAYAGTGKTSSLVMLGNADGRRGTYLAFNRAIADDAGRKFSSTVACSTQHSLAFRAMRNVYPPEKLAGSLSSSFLASRLSFVSYEAAHDLMIFPRGMAFLVLQSLRRWCNSGRAEIQEFDVPLEGKLSTIANPKALRSRVVELAKKAWEQMSDPKSMIPLGHDGYLKIWAMGRPEIPGRFIFLDEAQDSSGVIVELLKHQSAQLVCVGDEYQSIYQWKGAINAMDRLLPSAIETRLTMSFRFGPAIAEHATAVLGLMGESVPLRGNPDKESTLGSCEHPDTILARTNAILIEEVLGALENGQKPCVVGGVRELLDVISAAEKLMNKIPVEYPLEFFGFRNWSEVQTHAERPEGIDVRRVVKMIDDYGTKTLRTALESLPKNEEDADVVLSTGHKAKGLEWSRVRLCSDFLRGLDSDEEIDAKRRAAEAKGQTYDPPNVDDELRLYYVAATRAKLNLEIAEALVRKLKDNGVGCGAKIGAES